MRKAETFCVREVGYLLSSLESQFGCLNGDKLYSLVLSLKRSVERLNGENWCDTSDSLLRMSRYLSKLSVKVRVKTLSLGWKDAEMRELGDWLAYWCEMRAMDLMTWKRIELIRFLYPGGTIKGQLSETVNNVLLFRSEKKAA